MKKGTIIGIIIAVIFLGLLAIIGRIVIIGLIVVPNLTGIQEHAQVNADIRTAEMIGKSIRIWLTDGTTQEIKAREESIEGKAVEYDELKVEEYISFDMEPNSLKDAEYYVVGSNGIIKIAIAKEGSDVEVLGANDMYDGAGAGWAYVEGQY